MKSLTKETSLWLGVLLIAVILMCAIFAGALAPQSPSLMSLADRFSPPSASHPFGLDQNGADVFSQVLFGARVSLTVAFSAVLISVIIGLILGSIAGFFGGWLDLLLMRMVDMVYAFPGFLLALALVAVLGPSIQNLIFAMCLTGWASYARLIRGEVLHLKTREYVLSAVAAGAGPTRLIVVHIWPNLFGPLIVQATFGMAGTILTESGLSFLGLGAPPNVPTWGSLLNAGRKILVEAPHVSLFPGLAIITLVLGFNLAGDGLRAWLNRKSSI